MNKSIFIILICCFLENSFAQIGFGTSNPDPSAILELKSSDKGFLLPRLTISQKNNIANPAEGLMIYNSEYKCLSTYSSNNSWLYIGNCDFTQAVIDIHTVVYDGISTLNNNVGFVDDPEIKSIGVLYDAVDSVPFLFKAVDNTTGLEYSASGTTIAGTNNLVKLLPNNVTVSTPGIISMTLTGGIAPLTIEPKFDYKLSETEIVDISIMGDWDNNIATPETSKDWMDRNLGANRIPTTIDDIHGTGNYHQWGRLSDGHEIVYIDGVTNVRSGVGTTSILSTTDIPDTNLFILSAGDWRSSPNNNLWQGVNGINNPCPTGYRVPTIYELREMVSQLGITSRTTAFSSVMKIPANGYRSGHNTSSGGSFAQFGTNVALYSSTVVNSVGSVSTLAIGGSVNNGSASSRRHAFGIRCIKD